MDLVNFINIHLEKMYEQYDKLRQKLDSDEIEKTEASLKEIEDLLTTLESNIGNIRFLDVGDLEKIIGDESNISIEMSSFLKEFKDTKLVLRAIYDEKLPIVLTTKQELFISNFLVNLKDLKNDLSLKLHSIKEESQTNNQSLNEIEDTILSLEYLKDQIINPDDNNTFTYDDFELLINLINQPFVSIKDKKNAFIAIKNYNDARRSNIPKVRFVNSIAEVKECFKEFITKEDFFTMLDKKELHDEILLNADLNNIKAILTYLKSEDLATNKKNILGRFSNLTLLTICLYGNVNYIKQQYEKIQKNKDDRLIIYDIPSVWIRNMDKEVIVRRKGVSKPSTSRKNSKKNTNLSYQAHKNSYEEIQKNERFLINKGFQVSLDDEKNISALVNTPHFLLKENYEILKSYGVFDSCQPKNFAVSTFFFSQLADKCDRLIELGLFHPLDKANALHPNYFPFHPSIANWLNDNIALALYYQKQENNEDDYYQLISSERKNGNLSLQVRNGSLIKKLNNEDARNDFINSYFINQKDTFYIPNYKEFEKVILEDCPIHYDESILQLPEIERLEKYCRVDNNKYIYKFGDKVISRPKVLRIYSRLKQENIASEKDCLMYAITRQTYLDAETFDQIAQIIAYDYKGDKEYGLPK